MKTLIETHSSRQIDDYFGLDVDRIEQELLLEARNLRPQGDLNNLSHVLHQGQQTWVGLDPQTLQTPYNELLNICEVITPKDNELVLDLGAGYGRLGLVLNALYPKTYFRGFEYVEERVAEGQKCFLRHSCQNAQLVVQDLTLQDFKLPEADYYFIYDYGKIHHIRQTLKQLEKVADNKRFQVIARGKGTQSLIDYEHPWLSQVCPVIREENYSIYSF